MSLDDLRQRLDDVDRTIVEAVAERLRLVEEVAALKRTGTGLRVRDLQRESELLARIVALGNEAGADTLLLAQIYRALLDYSVRAQHNRLSVAESTPTLRVVYQGVEGAWSSIAARRHFASRDAEVRFDGLPTFRAILEEVRAGRADYAMLPIENTTAGSINEAYDLLASMDLALVGEEVQRVDHCLLALDPDARPTRALSHPQALAQCSDWLDRQGIAPVVWSDTAGACEQVIREADVSTVAIASLEAGERYGLHVIARGIANQAENFTRMVVVAAEAIAFDQRIPCKTSIVLALRHEEGALLEVLNVLGEHHLNLTKLESRPRLKTPWEYTFYVDFEGNLRDENVQHAIHRLAAHTNFLKVLGSYPSRTGRESRPARPLPPTRGLPSRQADRALRSEVDSQLRSKRYALASRLHRSADTRIAVKGAWFGGERPVVAAGPGEVSTAEELWACAKVIQACGADVLAVPSVPEELEGEVVAIGQETDLAVMVPVLDPARLGQLARMADILLIRSRDMDHRPLLRRVGSLDRPVVLERGPLASVDQWLEAAEEILLAGNQQVILCDTGVQTLAKTPRSALDLGALPVIRERTHLPILVDPVRAAGTWRWVLPMCRAALAGGAQGIVIPLAPAPAGAIGLSTEHFGELMAGLRSPEEGS